MDGKQRFDAHTAVELVTQACRDEHTIPSAAQRDELVAAVTEDLAAALPPDHLVSASERLAKVEAQTLALSEAVIAISESHIAVAPAIAAVKSEM